MRHTRGDASAQETQRVARFEGPGADHEASQAELQDIKPSEANWRATRSLNQLFGLVVASRRTLQHDAHHKEQRCCHQLTQQCEDDWVAASQANLRDDGADAEECIRRHESQVRELQSERRHLPDSWRRHPLAGRPSCCQRMAVTRLQTYTLALRLSCGRATCHTHLQCPLMPSCPGMCDSAG